MRLLRASLLAIAFSAIAIGLGVARVADNEPQTAAACARCGDGQCQRSCGENEKSCPRDCGGVPIPQASSR